MQFAATPATGPGTADVLYHTLDGGARWALVPFPANLGPYFTGGQLWFTDADHGWYLAVRIGGPESQDFTLFRTEDGGAHWAVLIAADIGHPIVHGLSYKGFKTGIRFADARTGSIGQGATHAEASLFLTDDEGADWRQQRLPDPPGGWPGGQTVIVSPATYLANGWAITTAYSFAPVPGGQTQVGAIYVYSSIDGGASWAGPRALPSPAGPVAFLAADHWWAGAGSRLWETTDGSAHWQAVGSAPAGWGFAGLHALDQSTAWAAVASAGRCPKPPCSPRERLAVTHDGGRHWSMLVPLPAP